ncbi:MAG: hypothetical protein HN383_05020 [Verrucomicrobia bacterium]|nr:hypothetical protein [Verrucomicrobiota bacterium]
MTRDAKPVTEHNQGKRMHKWGDEQWQQHDQNGGLLSIAGLKRNGIPNRNPKSRGKSSGQDRDK